MAAPMTVRRPTVDLSRTILRADGMLCGASGALLLAGARPISAFLGLDNALSIAVLGALFLPYAAGLVWLAGRPQLPRREVLATAVINTIWVVGSAGILLSGVPALTTGGKWAVAVVADIVALFAAAQFYALWRTR